MLYLYEESHLIDILTVDNILESKGYQFRNILSDYANSVTSSANLEYDARVLAQEYIREALISTSKYILEACYQSPTLNEFTSIQQSFETNIFKINQEITQKEPKKGFLRT